MMGAGRGGGGGGGGGLAIECLQTEMLPAPLNSVHDSKRPLMSLDYTAKTSCQRTHFRPVFSG